MQTLKYYCILCLSKASDLVKTVKACLHLSGKIEILIKEE